MKIKNKLKMSIKGLIGAMFLSGIFLGSPLASFAGSPVEASSEEGWTLIAEKGDVKAYARISTCGEDNFPVYLVKVENNSKTNSYLVGYSVNVLNDPTSMGTKSAIKIAESGSAIGTCDGGEANLGLMAIAIDGVPENFSQLDFKLLTLEAVNDEK